MRPREARARGYRSSGFRLATAKAVPQQKRGPARDCRISNVESRKVMTGRMKVEKIDDRTQPYAINYVADRAAEYQA